ncbi:MAG: hypothetical protein GY696_12380, partial [Gammaproteobacteria bacterium]|nr:hypothetical protein [Gammaproteobacteria bacterium]
LGFEWQGKYYVFCVLPFGLTSAPYVFTKLMRLLIRAWRERGIPAAIFIDDGFAILSSRQACLNAVFIIKADLFAGGCVTSKEKCVWDPRQILEWTGWVIDLAEFQISIPERRVNACVEAIRAILTSRGWTTARKLARVTGLLISMAVVLGPLTQLLSRFCYQDIVRRKNWDSKCRISMETAKELQFWQKKLRNVSSRSLHGQTRELTVVFSDASATGAGAHVTIDGVEQVSICQ